MKYAVLKVGESKPIEIMAINMPDIGEPGFYQQSVSFSSFFHGIKKRNWNGDLLYSIDTWDEFMKFRIGMDERLHDRHPDLPEIYKFTDIVFDSIWDFYKFIGWDYKKKKYTPM